jgi:hypothetical protein
MDILYNLYEDPQELNNLLGSNHQRVDFISKAEEIRDEMLEEMNRINHLYMGKLASSCIG